MPPRRYNMICHQEIHFLKWKRNPISPVYFSFEYTIKGWFAPFSLFWPLKIGNMKISHLFFAVVYPHSSCTKCQNIDCNSFKRLINPLSLRCLSLARRSAMAAALKRLIGRQAWSGSSFNPLADAVKFNQQQHKCVNELIKTNVLNWVCH